ncbi:signal peptidase II [Reyranella sp. CPCC 100927]|uniref:signal peptidase II n=1 Tax=Reyranella sp. CPCC 100927 TaxID=2599616 RepID=UPI001C498B2D|nr:signal peptidase II [Reyranella sp. CPCC 100927]
MTPLVRLGMGLAVAVAIVDQVSKHLLKALLTERGGAIEVIPGFFDLVTVWNRGVSFGMLGGDGIGVLPPWMLSAVAVAISIALFLWLRRITLRWTAMAIGLVIGGAVGNVIDRALWGAVFDFADFHVSGWHWPAFNVADAAIVLGVAALLVESVFRPQESRRRDG